MDRIKNNLEKFLIMRGVFGYFVISPSFLIIPFGYIAMTSVTSKNFINNRQKAEQTRNLISVKKITKQILFIDEAIAMMNYQKRRGDVTFTLIVISFLVKNEMKVSD